MTETQRPDSELSTDEKLDIVLAFVRKFERIAAVMSKHPMMASIMPSINREMADKT